MIIYTDGAATMKCVSGEYVRGNGGAAMAVVDNDNNIIYSENKSFKNTTNNYCELYAIFMALNYCKENCSEDSVEIYSDSAYCVNMLNKNGWVYSWEKNNWTRGKKHEKIENVEIIKEIFNLIQQFNVSFIKVKGHSNDENNNYVDKLAVAAKEKGE